MMKDENCAEKEKVVVKVGELVGFNGGILLGIIDGLSFEC